MLLRFLPLLLLTIATQAAAKDDICGADAVQLVLASGDSALEFQEQLAADGNFTGKIKTPKEGSLLPGSYCLPKGAKRKEVVARLRDAMQQTLSELWPNRRPETAVQSAKEAVILASLVEAETALPSELKMIAAVYSNRLRQGMMLQADATIIYPITKGKPLGRRIRQSEISAVNDYNTYSMVGLPKGPIANPSRAAIEAVLNPAKSDALFFVADGQGGHVFADTAEEHAANVEKWYAIRRARDEIEDPGS